MLSSLRSDLRSLANPEKASFFPKFFKSGPGEYGEGDQFLGVTVPNQRLIAKKYKDLPLSDLQKLLDSPWHEERLTALIILVGQFKKGEGAKQAEIYKFYLKNTHRSNNWDLVDTSARDIVGGYLFVHQNELSVLDQLAESKLLWDRRIAIISTYYFLMNGEPDLTIKLSEKLLNDNEDLIHKAVGWMLREMGKRCERQILIDFLDEHAYEMPRTTLRYALEHFDQPTRKKYLEMKNPE